MSIRTNTLTILLVLVIQTMFLAACGGHVGTQTPVNVPPGRFAYVANSFDNTVSIFAENVKDGQ